MVQVYSADYAAVGAVRAEAQTAVGNDIVSRVSDSKLASVHLYPDVESLERAVRLRDVAVGLRLPAEISDQTTTAIHLVGPPQAAVPSGVRALVEIAVGETAAVLQLGRTLEPQASDAEAIRIGRTRLPEQSISPASSTESRKRDSTANTLIGVLVLFVFMNTMGGADWLARIREFGILARGKAAGVQPGLTAIGFGLGLASYAIVQVALVLGVGWLAFGTTLPLSPSLILLMLLLVLSAGALSVLVAAGLPSPEMGTTIAGPFGFVLAMLGGDTLWPLEIVGSGLRAIGHLTPHAWIIDALHATAIDGKGIGSAATALLVLAISTVLLALLGAWGVQRRILSTI